MNIKSNCLLCAERSSVLMRKDYPGYQEPMKFAIYYCENCNTSYSLPRVNDSNFIYDNIYDNASMIPGYNRYWKYYRSIKNYKNSLRYLAHSEATYWGVHEALHKIVTNIEYTKILEIGSGLGYLTYALNKAGYDTVGLDISETAVQQANSYYGNYYVCSDLFNYADKKSNYFNIVILTEVIEHINEPLAFILQSLKLLKPGGFLVLTTPNKSLYPSDIIWNTESPPVHSWWFSEMSINYIGNKLNSNVNFIDFTNYYNNRDIIYNLKLLRNNPFRIPILDKNGQVKKLSKQYKLLYKIAFHRLLSKIPYFIEVYKYILTIFNSNIILCGQRGDVLCAIIQKKN